MMLGGVIWGYWATGSEIPATAPARVMTIDNTEAKIGRSIKKCENMPVALRPSVGPGRRLRRFFPLVRAQQPGQGGSRRLGWALQLGLNFRTSPDALHAVDDHALAWRKAFLDHP